MCLLISVQWFSRGYVYTFVKPSLCSLSSFPVLWLGEKSLRSLRLVHRRQLLWVRGIGHGDSGWDRPLAEQVLPGPRAGDIKAICGACVNFVRVAWPNWITINYYSCTIRVKFLPQNMSNYTIECNHGTQVGIYCECDKGWKSSGIHRNNPTVFEWCDVSMADPADITSRKAPKKLGHFVEVVACIVSSHYWE